MINILKDKVQLLLLCLKIFNFIVELSPSSNGHESSHSDLFKHLNCKIYSCKKTIPNFFQLYNQQNDQMSKILWVNLIKNQLVLTISQFRIAQTSKFSNKNCI